MASLRLFTACFFAAVLLAAGSTSAHVTYQQTFAAVKTDIPPPAAADLSTPVWQRAFRAADWYDFTTRRPAPLATTAYLLYDDKNLYVGFYAQQAGTPIIAPQTVDNAGVLTDDHVSFSFETSGSGARVYSFKVNARGVHDETSSENARYAPQWTGIARVLPNGDYVVVMIIPLSVVRAQSTPVQQWRVNFVRFVAATNEEYTWAYSATQTDVGSSQFWPVVGGIKIPVNAGRPRPHADVYGLASAGADRDQFQSQFGSFAHTKPRYAGVDLTVPITNTLAFVGTLDPDFSNVEQDQTTIAPQEFQRNFNEYRPFFAQGSQYINALANVSVNGPADQLFYTPSIGIFERGLKLEGTTGHSAIGALNVVGNSVFGGRVNDDAFGYAYSRADNSFGVDVEGVLANHAGDVRCPLATCHDDTFGVSVIGQNPRNGALSVVRYQAERGSTVDQPAQAQSFLATEGFQTSRLSAGVLYKDVGPEYNPLDGFTLINDIRGPQGFVQYNGTARGAIKAYNLGFVWDRFFDRAGAVHQADLVGGPAVTFKNLISVNLNFGSSLLGQWMGAPDGGGQPSALAYPDYRNPHLHPVHTATYFNQQGVFFGYKDGTPTPTDASYSAGPFGGSFLQQITASTTQNFGRGVYGLNVQYQGTIARALPGHAVLFNGYDYTQYFAGKPVTSDSQWLRRIALTRSFGKDASLAIGLRSINGYGGFAVPGTNLAISFHRRFANANELYVDFGTPAASATLNRLIVKYVFHAGGATGT